MEERHEKGKGRGRGARMGIFRTDWLKAQEMAVASASSAGSAGKVESSMGVSLFRTRSNR